MPTPPPSPPALPALLAAADAANAAVGAYVRSLPGWTPRTAGQRRVLAGLVDAYVVAERRVREAGAGLVRAA